MHEFEKHPEAGEILGQAVWEIPTDIREINKYEEELGQMLTKFRWDEEANYFVRLAFSESLVNAIVHANLGLEKASLEDYEKQILEAQNTIEAKNKKVLVNAEVTSEKILITIQDMGGEKGKDMFAKKFLAEDPRTKENILKTSGRGGILMQHAFGPDGVHYELNDLGTKLILEKQKETN